MGYIRRDGTCVDDDECLRFGSSRRRRQSDYGSSYADASEDDESEDNYEDELLNFNFQEEDSDNNYEEGFLNFNDDLKIGQISGSGCDRNARCVNTEGSYFCKCNSGFAGDGQQD